MPTKPDIGVRKIAAGESLLSPPKNVRPDSAPPRNHLEMRRGASGRARGEKCWRSTRRRQRCGPFVDDVPFCPERGAGSVAGDHRAVGSPVKGRSQSASASAGTPPSCPLSSREEEDWDSGRDPKIDLSKTNVSETPGPRKTRITGSASVTFARTTRSPRDGDTSPRRTDARTRRTTNRSQAEQSSARRVTRAGRKN